MKHIIFAIIFLLGLSFSLETSALMTTAYQRDKILGSHNAIRKSLQLPTLIWDSAIEKNASAWAENLAKKDILEHSESGFRGGRGENIYRYWTTDRTLASDGSDAVYYWLAESTDYSLKTNSCRAGMVCGHYTQIVWKNTERIGCGKATARRDGIFKVYWVCQYDPSGNYVGQKPY